MHPSRIIVGVDGSAGARSALLWAADEASIRRDSLLVLHAPGPSDTASIRKAGEPAILALDEAGERLLQECLSAASARQPGVPVTTLLSHARAADTLIDLSRDADLVVAGTRGVNAPFSTILGSVCHRVAAQAHCPVALVPEAAALSTRVPTADIVVGASGGSAARLALGFAVDEAGRRGATVVAVRTFSGAFAEAPRRPAAGRADRLDGHANESFERDRESFERDLEPIRAARPDVPIVSSLVVAEPAEALLAAAGTAQLIVIGCHHSDDPWSTRLGPVPNAILDRAPCPLVVVGERRHDSA